MNFDWSDLAFGSKRPVNNLNAAFIAAPRELSAARFKELVKEYLPQGNIVLGLAKEPYIDGFDGQPQFKTLQIDTVQTIIDKVNASPSKHKIYTLKYFQRELPYLLEKLAFGQALFVNGSWKYAFHTQTPYYTLINKHIPYRLVSPFTDKAEALRYEASVRLPALPTKGSYSDTEMLELADQVARHSFDNGFQTGVSLGRKKNKTYQLLALTFNRVVPYQTYAMLHGASREVNFSPTNDLNHYDTTHAEVELLVAAGKQNISLKNTTLFINLLPCPTCARMFTQTDIAEFVYREDHSDGYAVRMLEAAGKKVRRVVA